MKGLSKGRYDETFAGEDDFCQNQRFRHFLSGIPSGCQKVWIQISPTYRRA